MERLTHRRKTFAMPRAWCGDRELNRMVDAQRLTATEIIKQQKFLESRLSGALFYANNKILQDVKFVEAVEGLVIRYSSGTPLPGWGP